jgi:hypothetical protein
MFYGRSNASFSFFYCFVEESSISDDAKKKMEKYLESLMELINNCFFFLA